MLKASLLFSIQIYHGIKIISSELTNSVCLRQFNPIFQIRFDLPFNFDLFKAILVLLCILLYIKLFFSALLLYMLYRFINQNSTFQRTFMDSLTLERKNKFLNRSLLHTFSIFSKLQQTLENLAMLISPEQKLCITQTHQKIIHLKSQNQRLVQQFLTMQLLIHQTSELQIILKLYQQKISDHRLMLHHKSNCLQQILQESYSFMEIDYLGPRSHNLRKFTLENIGRCKVQKLLKEVASLRNSRQIEKNKAISMFTGQTIAFPQKVSLVPWEDLQQMKIKIKIQQERQTEMKEKCTSFKNILNILKRENKELKRSLYKNIGKNNGKIKSIEFKEEQNKQNKNQSSFWQKTKIDKTIALKPRYQARRKYGKKPAKVEVEGTRNEKSSDLMC